ncbi:ELWxxDGT repeat protein [Emticicia sp.]|uniref:ELWxxDGT repeat protein n=1 Tax=Emticicia sp. TaxID=1930953 RepID=UPI0037519652
MKKISLFVIFACFGVSEVVGQIIISGTNSYDATYNVGNYVNGSNTLAPTTFDAGTNYYHGLDSYFVDIYGPHYKTVFVTRINNFWTITQIITGYQGVNMQLFHTEVTFFGNNPPCNAWWIRNADNIKVAIQINGTTCENNSCNTIVQSINSTENTCYPSSNFLTSSGCSGTYKWSNGETTSIIEAASSGKYAVACDDGTACPSMFGLINVNLPTPITKPTLTQSISTAVEPNTAVTLTSNACASPNSLLWEDNSTSLSRTVSPSTSSVYSAKCVNNTCESDVAFVAITVNAPSTSCVEHWEKVDYSTPIKSGTNLYFTKNQPVYGYELWKADLNMNNASMVKNINAKKIDFVSYGDGAELNGIWYFTASDDIDGFGVDDLWRTDGTAIGTYKVINFSGVGIENHVILKIGNLLYFNVNDGTSSGLWRSDGTSNGSFKIANYTMRQSSTDYKLVGNIVYFNNSSPGSLTGFCKTDGTIDGTTIIKNNLVSGGYVELNGILYFSGSSSNIFGLWRTDGSTAGTALVKNVEPQGITVFNGKLFFGAYSSTYGNEIWVSDGTTAGTTILKDIASGSGGSNAGYFSVLNGFLYFQANDGTNGAELWRTDGTTSGTALFKDIVAGSGGSNPRSDKFILIGTKSYFLTLSSTTFQWSVCETDGTSAGTVIKFNIGTATGGKYADLYKIGNNLYYNYDGYYYRVNGALNGGISIGQGKMMNLVVFGDYIYYNIYNNSTNPITASIRRVSLTTYIDEAFKGTGTGTSYDKQFVYNGALHFTETANNGTNQSNSLWKTDGNIANTALYFSNNNVKDGDAYLKGGKDVNGIVYFTAFDGTSTQVWKTDGTNAGTIKLSNIPNLYLTEIMEMSANIGNTFFFTVRRDSGGILDLWKSDGTVAGTVLLKSNIYYFLNTSSTGEVDNLFVNNGFLYFSVRNSSYGMELWKTDGTVAGTTLLKSFEMGYEGGITGLNSIGNNVFFYANDGAVWGLYKTDGTPSGTILLKNNSTTSGRFESVAWNSYLYFGFSTSDKGNELWKTDGTVAGTQMVKDIVEGSYGSGPRNFLVFNNTLFFAAGAGIGVGNGSHLWKSDGTRFGTQLVKSFTINSYFSSPFIVKGNEFYFIEYRSADKYLWKTDGTTNGTKQIPNFQAAMRTPSSIVENKIYSSRPSLNIGVYVLTTNPIPAPIIISAYDVVYPNTQVSLLNNNCANEILWNYRNITSAGATNGSTASILDIPPATTVYTASCREKVCVSAPASKTITIYSCPPNLSLASTSDDINSGIITRQANSTNGSITATNKITGTAKVTYQAKNIQLNAGFKADNGTVFKAEIGGCN